MEKLKKSILDVMEAYQHIPFSTLAKNENAHRSILLGIEKATELFSDSTAEQIKYEIHDILTEVGLAKAEILAYKEIDPPDDWFEQELACNEFMPSTEDLKEFQDACKSIEDSLPF